MRRKRSEAEEEAIARIKREGGMLLITLIPERSGHGVFGEIEPGMGVYRRLEREGVIVQTEEEGDWTPSFVLVEGVEGVDGKEGRG